MKFYLSLIAFALFNFFSHAQGNRISPHYVLPEFTEAMILLNDGSIQKGVLNYNALSENFALKNDDDIVGLSKRIGKNIDTVYIANRKFFRKDSTFFELLLNSKVQLYVEYKCDLESATEASSGYGGTSQTTSSTSTSMIANNSNFYELELPDLYKAKPKSIFWLKKEKILTKIETLGHLKKLYKSKKKDIKTYRKTHDVDFKVASTVSKLVEHLEGL